MRPTESRTQSPLLNNAGFTLLEIIAVLVIMAILAVVAVPRYFDLQAEARNKAMQSALAEAIGRANGYFAQQVLSGRLPQDIGYVADPDAGVTEPPLGTDLGDFELEVLDGGSGPTTSFDPSTCFDDTTPTGVQDGCLKFIVTAKPGSAVEGADPAIKSIPRPGI